MTSNSEQQDDHLSRLRRFEFGKVKHFFNTTYRVLEIGGGSGFQASLLSELVEEVVSIDVNSHPAPVAEVSIYDGANIPFPDKYFDAIFSSNALEHIEDIDNIILESKRVLKDEGIAVHIVPTVSWRIFTSLAHYPGMPRLFWSNYQNLKSKISEPTKVASDSQNLQKKSNTNNEFLELIGMKWIWNILGHFKVKWIKSILWSPRHGERGNALTEAVYYRSTWWRKMFEANGMAVLNEFPLGIFYTGNTVFGTLLPITWRQFLSKIFGSSTRLILLKKNNSVRHPLIEEG